MRHSKDVNKHAQNMCYYDNYQYACRDWKWGNFRQHCHKEFRTGETCGMKMIFQTLALPEKCTQCEKIERKLRRREKAVSDVQRWQREGGRFRASIEKAIEDIAQLDREIHNLKVEKDRRYQNIGNSRRN